MAGDADIDWRPIERTDVAAWSATLTEIQHADRDWEFLTEQDLLSEFGHPDHDFPRGSVGVFSGGVMAAFGTVTVRSEANPVHDMRYWGGVHPDWRHRGLGSRLLDWAEDAAARLHQERFPGLPLSLSGSSLQHNPDAAALFAAHGYQPVRWFQVMSRDLTAPLPDAPLAADVRVVPFSPEVAEDARCIRNEAFADHWGSTETSAEAWAHHITSGTLRFGFSFVAYAGSEPAVRPQRGVRGVQPADRRPGPVHRPGRHPPGGPRAGHRLGPADPGAGRSQGGPLYPRLPGRGLRLADRRGGPVRAGRLHGEAHLGHPGQDAATVNPP